MHEYAHPRGATGKILGWSLAVTLLFVAVETVAGIEAHSLALLSDAGHNFTDALALLLAAFAWRVQSKPPDEIKTYGYHRAGVLAAFVNALTLLALSAFIFWESYHRLRQPPKVDDTTMLVVAALGLLVNAGIMWGLRQDRLRDLNVRAAFVHMLGDALGSAGIIAGAIVIRHTGWQRVDPALSILIAALIVWTARDIVRESLNILLEGLPRGLRLGEVVKAMKGVDGVLDVHDLHIWSLGSSAHALSCHILIADVPPSESDSILLCLNRTLEERFHIHHTTVQFEHRACLLGRNGCSIPPSLQ